MENPNSLGEFLRHEREKRGLTLEQVASATKISVKLLVSLESDQYSDLPAKPFVRGFVNSYCRFIGVDSREVLTQFGGFIEKRSHERPNREAGHSGYAFDKKEGEQSRTILGVVMVTIAIVGGIGFAFLKKPSRHHRGAQVEKLRAAASPVAGARSVTSAVAVLPVASPSPAVTSAKEVLKEAVVVSVPTPSVSSGVVVGVSAGIPAGIPDPLNSGVGLKPSQIKHKLIIKAEESAWVRYQCDDRTSMQFILKKGKILVLRAEQRIVFQTANPERIVMSANGTASQRLTQRPGVMLHQNDATWSFPPQLIETIKEPFPGQKPLTGRFVPVSSVSSPSSPSAQ